MPEPRTVKGRIVATGPGQICIRTDQGKRIWVDRFAAVRMCPDGDTIFVLPQGPKKKHNSARDRGANNGPRQGFSPPSLQRTPAGAGLSESGFNKRSKS